MPHQCVRCSLFYPDGAKELLAGCPCGGKLFFFIKKERLEELKKEVAVHLKPDEKFQMEQDVFAMLGVHGENPVILDFESVRMLAPGKYEIDIGKIFRDEPLIFKLDEGKYVVDVPQVMRRKR